MEEGPKLSLKVLKMQIDEMLSQERTSPTDDYVFDRLVQSYQMSRPKTDPNHSIHWFEEGQRLIESFSEFDAPLSADDDDLTVHDFNRDGQLFVSLLDLVNPTHPILQSEIVQACREAKFNEIDELVGEESAVEFAEALYNEVEKALDAVADENVEAIRHTATLLARIKTSSPSSDPVPQVTAEVAEVVKQDTCPPLPHTGSLRPTKQTPDDPSVASRIAKPAPLTGADEVAQTKTVPGTPKPSLTLAEPAPPDATIEEPDVSAEKKMQELSLNQKLEEENPETEDLASWVLA